MATKKVATNVQKATKTTHDFGPGRASSPSAMARSLIRLLVVVVFGSLSIVAVSPLVKLDPTNAASSTSVVGQSLLLFAVAVIATVAFYFALEKLAPFLDTSSLAQASFLDTLNAKSADVAIFLSAALSLFSSSPSSGGNRRFFHSSPSIRISA